MFPSHWPTDHVRGQTFYDLEYNRKFPVVTCRAPEKHGLLHADLEEIPESSWHTSRGMIYEALFDGPATAAELAVRFETSRDVVAAHLTMLAQHRRVQRIGFKPGTKAILWRRTR